MSSCNLCRKKKLNGYADYKSATFTAVLVHLINNSYTQILGAETPITLQTSLAISLRILRMLSTGFSSSIVIG